MVSWNIIGLKARLKENKVLLLNVGYVLVINEEYAGKASPWCHAEPKILDAQPSQGHDSGRDRDASRALP